MFESDIPVLTRILIDEYTDSDEVSIGHKELIFDIEVSSENGFPDVQSATNEILSIAWYDKAAKMQGVYVLDKTLKYENFVLEDDTVVEFFQTEEELLSKFFLKWTEIQPTIVSGWNVERFDIPYLYHRATVVLGKEISLMLSPIQKILWNDYKQMYKIAGVAVLDYLGLYKKFTYTQESSYNLDAIGRKEVNHGKLQYGGTLDNLFKNDIKKFIEYNMGDVIIVKKIDEKMKLLDLVKSICHRAHVPYEDVYYSSRVIDGAILTYLKRLGIVAPNKKYKSNEDAEEDGVQSFTGAYVKEPIPGRYFWIYDLDMTSLYPSVIMSLNISPETKIGKIEDWVPETFVMGKSTTHMMQVNEKHPRKITTDEVRDFVEQHKYSIAVNGVMYKMENTGLIPSILDAWFKERVEYRNLMTKFGKSGDTDKFEYFRMRQHVQKILLNSVYGVLGLPTCRFYDRDCAEATTTTGVAIIKYCEQMVNHYYNKILSN